MNAILNALCDAQDSLRECVSPDDLWRCGLRLFDTARSSYLTAGSIPGARHDAPLLRTSLGADLMQDYIAENIHAEDPWMQYCAQSNGVDRLDVASGVRSNGPRMPPRMTDLFRTHGIHRISLVPCTWGRQSWRHGGLCHLQDSGEMVRDRGRRCAAPPHSGAFRGALPARHGE
jgi:hypothetical protein